MIPLELLEPTTWIAVIQIIAKEVGIFEDGRNVLIQLVEEEEKNVIKRIGMTLQKGQPYLVEKYKNLTEIEVSNNISASEVRTYSCTDIQMIMN